MKITRKLVELSMYTTCNYIVLDKKKVTMYYYNYYVAVLTIS